MNPSGGLQWHFRAWRSRTLWSPTCVQLTDWLAQLQPKSKQLILLGPSAGWMLPSAWLQRFDYIHAIDLDPLAPRLFARRHGAALKAGGVRWQYQSADALTELPRLLQAYPHACVFFDNVLGQLRFHVPKGQDPQQFAAHHLTQIKRHLQGREWGSVHDLLSGPAKGLSSGQDFPAARMEMSSASPQLAQTHQPDTTWLAAARPHGQWLDHLTDAVFPPSTSVQNLAWAFKPRYWHWLQAGWVGPGRN
jgi:hypothetical protein